MVWVSKKRTIITYDENLWNALERFVIQTYGTKYSFFGRELEKAVKYHLATMGFEDFPDTVVFPGEHGKTVEKDITHTQKLKGNVKTLFKWVVNNEDDAKIPYVAICNFIRRECGIIDNRTYKKYAHTLVKLGVLDKVDDGMAYRLNPKENYLSLYVEYGKTVVENST